VGGYSKVLGPDDHDDSFYPVLLRTVPPTVLTRGDVVSKVPWVKVLHIPATHPRAEDCVVQDLPESSTGKNKRVVRSPRRKTK